MGLTVDGRPVHRLTADQALAMLAAGIIPEDNRLELLGGVLTEKPVKSPEHEVVKERLTAWLAPAVAARRIAVRVEGCLVVPEITSLPEPDLMVLAPGQPPGRHPTTALLIVEVAVSSLPTDLGRKAELYAAAAVPEYWVVDVEGRRLLRFTDPHDGRYARQDVLTPGDEARPRCVEVAPLEVAAVLAGLA